MSGLTDAQRFRPQRLLLVGLAALLALLTLTPLATSRMHVWPWKGLALLWWMIPCGWLLQRWLSRDAFVRPRGVMTSALALLALAAVTSATVGPYASLSLPHVWPTLGGVAIFLLAHDVLHRHPEHSLTTGRGLAIVGAALAIGSLIIWSWSDAGITWAARNEHPFGHSIYTAGALVWVLPWLVWAAVRHRGGARLLAIVGTALVLLVLWSTKSRAGILATVTSAGVAGAWLLHRSVWSWQRKIVIVVALVLFGLLAVLSDARLRHWVLERGWSAAAQESNDQRTAMVQAGLLIGAERPLLGWGPGTVPLRYPFVRRQLDGGVDNVLQLHNTPVQLWATLGLPGVAASLLLAIGLGGAALGAARQVTRDAEPVSGRAKRPAEPRSGEALHAEAAISRRSGEPEHVPERSAHCPTPRLGRDASPYPIGSQALVVTVLSSLAGYAVFALTDHQLDVPFMNLMAAVHAALLCTLGARPQDEARVSAGLQRWGVVAVSLGLLAIPLWPTARDLLARRAYAEDRFPDAIALMPRDAYYQHQLASHVLKLRFQARTAQERQDYTLAAVEILQQAAATEVQPEYAHFNLGWLLLEANRPQAAVEQFRAAATLAPTRGGVYFGWGLALRAAQQEDAAITAFALEALNDPAALQAPGWETEALAPLRADVTNRLALLLSRLEPAERSRLATRARWVEWWAGNAATPPPAFSEESQRFLEALPAMHRKAPLPERPYPWSQLYEAWRSGQWEGLHPDEAFLHALQRRAERHPDNFVAYLKAGTENDDTLVQTVYRVRPGAGLHAFHPDGPPLMEAYVVQTNRLLSQFAGGLFPPRSSAPGPLLLELALQ